MILACINHKGGAGKTTVSQNLAVYFAHGGNKVCIIDTDESENSLVWYEERSEDLPMVNVHSHTRHTTLKKYIHQLYNQEGYDVIIIDGRPTLAPITEETIKHSHLIVIPTRPDSKSDIISTEQLANKIKEVEEMENKPISAFFLINQTRSNLTIQKEFHEGLKQHSEVYNIPVLNTKWKLRTVFGKANGESKGVIEMNDREAKQEVKQLADEIQTIFNAL